MVIGAGQKEELKNCFYTRCPSIFVRGGELTLNNVTLSSSTPVNGTGVLSVEIERHFLDHKKHECKKGNWHFRQ